LTARKVYSRYDGAYRGRFTPCGDMGGTIKAGRPCPMAVVPGTDRCWHHLPEGRLTLRKRFGAERLLKLVELLERGETQQAAGREVGLTQGQVARLLEDPAFPRIRRRRWWAGADPLKDAEPRPVGAFLKLPDGSWVELQALLPFEHEPSDPVGFGDPAMEEGGQVAGLLVLVEDEIAQRILHRKALLDFTPLANFGATLHSPAHDLPELLFAMQYLPDDDPFVLSTAPRIQRALAARTLEEELQAFLDPFGGRGLEVLLARACPRPRPTYEELAARFGASRSAIHGAKTRTTTKLRSAFRSTPLPRLRTAFLLLQERPGFSHNPCEISRLLSSRGLPASTEAASTVLMLHQVLAEPAERQVRRRGTL
jgi:hypothetical protein